MIAWAFFVKKENPITEEDIQELINYANQDIYITPLPVDGQRENENSDYIAFCLLNTEYIHMQEEILKLLPTICEQRNGGKGVATYKLSSNHKLQVLNKYANAYNKSAVGY